MILGTGIDIIEIDRIAKAVQKNPSFVERYFSPLERQYFQSRKMRYEVIAGNFAAKEAFSKALGTGIRNFALHEVEVLRDPLGKPYINLYGAALTIYTELKIDGLHVSISHCKDYAIASVIAEKICAGGTGL